MIKVNNKSLISLAKKHVLHDRSKQIKLRYHFILVPRNCLETKKIKIIFVTLELQLADMLTDPLSLVELTPGCLL